MLNDTCDCCQTIRERKKLTRKLLHLNHDDLNADTIHSLRHSGYRNVQIVVDHKVPAYIVNKSPFWKTISRTIQLNDMYLLEEIDIEDGIVTGTRYKSIDSSLLINVCPSLVIKAEEV